MVQKICRETLHVHKKEGSWPYTLEKSFEERLYEVKQNELINKVHITDKVYLFDDPKKKVSLYEKFKKGAENSLRGFHLDLS